MTLIYNKEQITFNGNTLKLSQFSKLKPRPQNDAKFIKFAFLDLKKVDEHDSNYWNLAIRANSKETQTRIENQQTSFENEGFLTEYWPPIVGVDEKPRDGRGRIIAAKRNGERYIPVAVYSYNNDSKRNYISNGLLANFHNPSVAAKMEDFIVAGVTLIKSNELKNEKCEIENWLYKEIQINKFFNNNSGNITKILNAIQDRAAEGGEPLVAVRQRDEWIDWLHQRNYKIDGKKLVLYSADKPNTYPGRCWTEDVLPMCNQNNATLVKIILYTGDHVPDTVIKNVKKFEKQLDYFYNSSYKMVNKNLAGITLQTSDKKPYKVIGAIPQIYGRHDLTSKELISIDEY